MEIESSCEERHNNASKLTAPLGAAGASHGLRRLVLGIRLAPAPQLNAVLDARSCGMERR